MQKMSQIKIKKVPPQGAGYGKRFARKPLVSIASLYFPPQGAGNYTQIIIKTCQENLEEAINVKASDATKYEYLKEDFRFLNQRSSQLMEEIDGLRQTNEKLL